MHCYLSGFFSNLSNELSVSESLASCVHVLHLRIGTIFSEYCSDMRGQSENMYNIACISCFLPYAVHRYFVNDAGNSGVGI